MTALRQVPDAEVVAVCSRTDSSARNFALQRGIARWHNSYEALARDPDVDIIYVATPHSRHRDDTEMYLRSGKHVLCEKPFALNLRQAQSMVDTARNEQRFVMEAIWSRFLPTYVALGRLLETRPLGRITSVSADFGFVAPTASNHRLNDPSLGGGALLDLGIYCLHFARFVLGAHESLSATGELSEQGVDVDSRYVLTYQSGATADLRSTTRHATPCTATIRGDEGVIHVDRHMHNPPGFAIKLNGAAERYRRFDDAGHGLRHQAVEVQRCIELGFIESPLLPHAETLALAATMDDVRRIIGVRYEADAEAS